MADLTDKYSTSPVSYRAYLKKQAEEELKSLPQPTLQQPTSAPTPFLGSSNDPSLPVIPIPQSLQQAMLNAQHNPQSQSQSRIIPQQYAKQGGILGQAGPITENFGDLQPGVEVFSHGFTNGTGIGVPDGTTVALPGGKWQVLSSYGEDSQPGYIGDGTNSGYGNSVLAQNTQTGEKLRFSHLSRVNANSGDLLDGGSVIGLSGETGNVTGPHLNLEYYDQNGKIADVMRSLYAAYLNMQQ